jgi:3-hydroxy-9,10-secoandrosta-1,3,5(10)-triene-9,17-dione monooxygenase
MTTTQHGATAPPADLTPAAAAAVADRLSARIIEEAPETERRTAISPELHEELRAAGLYRMLVPRRFGGYGFDLPSFLDVVMRLARADMSTGWCFCLPAGHAYHVACWFDADVQAEVFGDGHFVCPMTAAPGGTARRDGDEWIVESRHPYCSGAPYSTHYIGQLFEPDPQTGRPRQPLVFIAPRDAYEVLDDWGATLGLKGSGSNTIVLDGVRIPHRHVKENFLQTGFMPDGTTPGYELHGDPMYLSPPIAFFCLELSTLMVGGVLGALDEYEHLMRTRKTTGRPPIIPRTEHQDYQRWYAQAAGRLAVAEGTIRFTAERWMETCRRAEAGGAPFGKEDDMLLNMMAREALRIAWDVLQESIMRTAGSSAARNGERLERIFRDATMCWGHVNMIIEDFIAREYSSARFGVPAA